MNNLAVFCVVFGVYYFTAFSSLPGGDSGELLADGCLQGIAHPPGYPTFLMMSHFWGKLPITRAFFTSDKSWTYEIDSNPTIAWKINIMCAFLGAMCAVCIASSVTVALKACGFNSFRNTISAICAFLFAFSPLIWEYSVTAEVFALNNSILAAQILFTIKVIVGADKNSLDSREAFNLCMGALLSGLAISNQHTSFIQQVCVIPFALISTLKRLSFPRIIAVSLCFFAGISPYYYLVIASAHPKLGSWGDQTTWSGFLKHVLRSEYGTFQLGVKAGAESMVERIIAYASFTSREFHHIVFPFWVISVIVSIALFTKKSVANKKSEESSLKSTKTIKNKHSEAESTDVLPSNAVESNVGLRHRKKDKPTGGAAATPNINNAGSNESNARGQLQPGPPGDNSKVSGSNARRSDASGYETSTPLMLLLCLQTTWLFYIVCWHGTLSNLPLSAPMPYAVHARFWMQPNIPLVVLAGVGMGYLVTISATMLSDPWSNELRPPLTRKLLLWVAESLLIAAASYFIVKSRYQLMDKSRDGWTLHKYAQIAMASFPRDSIVLTHTDLDWNSMRYLRSCESMRSDLKLLSLQLMPYPWFQSKQSILYENMVFPSTNFPEISTDKTSEGNARLILDFIHANRKNRLTMTENDIAFMKLDALEFDEPLFSPGVFLDMQAVNEVEIGDGGLWRNMTLLPWGTMYRVLDEVPFDKLLDLHALSWIRINKLKSKFPTIDNRFFEKYPAGSWEYAAASVYFDAHYQLGLNLLTHSLEVLKTVDLVRMVLLIDRMHAACKLLEIANHAAVTWGAISSSMKDVRKNTAVCFMRFYSVLSVAVSYKLNVEKEFYAKPHRIIHNRLFDAKAIDSIINARVLRDVTTTAIRILREQAKAYPTDHDSPTFAGSADGMEAEMNRVR